MGGCVERVIVLAVAITIVSGFVLIGWMLSSESDRISDETDDLIDDMENDLQKDPGYEYSVSNVDLNLSLTFEFGIEVEGEAQASQPVTFDIIFQCELYSISCLLNDDGNYDLTIDIVDLHLNVSVTTQDNITGGTLVIDDFHYEGIVDECTDEAVREALLEVSDLEQWSMEV